MKKRFEGRSRGSIGKSITSKATRLGIVAKSAAKRWTLREMESLSPLEEDLSDDEAWEFLEDYAKKRTLGDVPDSIRNLIASTVNSAVTDSIAKQYSDIANIKRAIASLDKLWRTYQRIGCISEEELTLIDKLFRESMSMFSGLESAILAKAITVD